MNRSIWEPTRSIPPTIPTNAHRVASQVERGDARRGVLLCGTGLGMAYAANRHHGVASRRGLDSGGRPVCRGPITMPMLLSCRLVS